MCCRLWPPIPPLDPCEGQPPIDPLPAFVVEGPLPRKDPTDLSNNTLRPDTQPCGLINKESSCSLV